ncbi:aminotransferase class V-fold PLP-dependent enzyme [Alkalimonas collagenimarina]|uniref:Aminotransferase class V-fold PLP-dependent enzyme n=1 Tax=Alkalimonas collagenimarina TaxID=400390 RepID=A0ABT9GUI8_9GAMM|nr:aminotransferase class V-fold PLP-dependent enzyme [Alkalimonas collagenimarina]MDP4534719.1 aminotransferase class V-fold PLP-dependent enzyme [Alkalimonas collagenimarina]
MQRREFLTKTSLLLGSSLLSVPAMAQANLAQATAPTVLKAADWSGLRDLFALSRQHVHLATFLLSSHPRPVAEAIERHRRAFDENPADYYYENVGKMDKAIAEAAAEYMGGNASQIAMTDSTTMGLAMVASGLMLRPDDEILQTEHDHYAMDLSLQLRAERTDAKVRRVSLYDNPALVSKDEVLSKLKAAITPATKVVSLTWVHSMNGVKLPIHEIAKMLAELNQTRDEADQILYVVDGVHGFGIENIDVSTVGCDFFIAGTHKWLFGPRGTGVIWGSDRGWAHCKAVVPSFSRSYAVWLGYMTQDQVPPGEHMTPGGFHAFDHRWALPEAFKLHLQLGKAEVQQRIHQLNTLTKQGLQQIKGVTLHTPMSAELSSGMVCFDYKELAPWQVDKAMHEQGIIISTTPYRRPYARFAPSLINNEQEIERSLTALSRL